MEKIKNDNGAAREWYYNETVLYSGPSKGSNATINIYKSYFGPPDVKGHIYLPGYNNTTDHYKIPNGRGNCLTAAQAAEKRRIQQRQKFYLKEAQFEDFFLMSYLSGIDKLIHV